MNKSKQVKPTGSATQKGGGSDWSESFYSYFMSPAELSRYTLLYIDQAPMFHPLQFGTVFPTGTTGIIPTGVYLANQPQRVASDNYADAMCKKVLGSQCVKGNPTAQIAPQSIGRSATQAGQVMPVATVGDELPPTGDVFAGTTGTNNLPPQPPVPQGIVDMVGTGSGANLPNLKTGKQQQGGAYDYSFFHPASYPSIPLSPEYIGVTCGAQGSDPGIARLPFGANALGLERCQVHYSSTNSYGKGCEVCANGAKPSIWNVPSQDLPIQTGGACSTFGGSCSPCNRTPDYTPGQDCADLYNQLLALDPDRLMRLCRDNYVTIYHMDKETGRLTPDPKPKLCRRLCRKWKRQGMLH